MCLGGRAVVFKLTLFREVAVPELTNFAEAKMATAEEGGFNKSY